MAGSLELLEAAHAEREAHEHLLRECPWYQHIDKGGRDHPDLHCRPATGEPRGLNEGGALVKFTPRTPEASTVVKPTVPPGGPGLFHMKGHHLPPYIEHLYPHLVARYGKHDAYGVAVGIVKKWAAGINPGGWKTKSGKGKRTHPDVRAAAQKNVAEWEKEKAEAHEHAAASAVGLAARGPQMMTAPGTRPTFVPPTPGGQYQQYGMYQNPVQSVSPSPPLPPSVPLPTAAEVLAVIPLVPESVQADLSRSARKFLEQAARKLSVNDPLAALAMLRSAQASLFSAHKADQGVQIPAAYVANVYTRIPPGAQSSATNAMKLGTEQLVKWRKAEQEVGALTDRIRKRYFHGVYNGPSQMARFTEDGMTALDRILALAATVTTGKDVSFPVESDTSGATPLLQAPEGLLDIADEDARRELDALPPVDRQRVDAYLAAARRMVATNPFGASQMALRAAGAASAGGARDLARHIHAHVRALAEARNLTNPADAASRMEAGSKTVSPQNSPQTVAETGNNATSLTAVERLQLAAAGSSAGSSAGSGFGSPGAAERLGQRIGIQVVQAPSQPSRTHRSRTSSAPGSSKGGPVIHSAGAPAGEPGPASYAHHLHELHMQHVSHVAALHAAHVAHMEHLAHQQRFGNAG